MAVNFTVRCKINSNVDAEFLTVSDLHSGADCALS